MEGRQSVGDRIKEARKKKGWTQQELADIVQCSRESICSYEKRAAYGSSLFESIADALEVSSYYLATGCELDSSEGTKTANEAVNAVADIYECQDRDNKKKTIKTFWGISIGFTVMMYILVFTGVYSYFVNKPKETFASLVCLSVAVTTLLSSTLYTSRVERKISIFAGLLLITLSVLTGIPIFI